MHIMLLIPKDSIFGKRFLKSILDAGHKVSVVGDHDPMVFSAEKYRFFGHPLLLEKIARILHLSRLAVWIRICYLSLVWHFIKPDLVHVHWIDARAYECVQANLHPLVISAWGSDINDFFIPSRYSDSYRNRILKVLLSADLITADTVDILRKCEAIAGKRLNTSLMYLGIDFDFFKPGYIEDANHLKQQLGISAEQKVILSIRALKPLYCHQYILDAFSILLTDPQYQYCRLVLKRFLDKSDDYYWQLCELIELLGITDQVVWIDALPDEKMPILYAMSDVVISYPERDAFPVSFLETASCKRLMISSDLPAYRGIFPPDSFWMVPPHNVQELCKALKNALSATVGEAQNRIDMAYATAWQIGEWNQCIKATNSLYQKVIDSKV